MRLSNNEIEKLQRLLSIRREVLHLRLEEQALDGPHTAPATILHIKECRTEIAHLKEDLRAAGVDVDDLPTDKALYSVQQTATPAQRRVVAPPARPARKPQPRDYRPKREIEWVPVITFVIVVLVIGVLLTTWKPGSTTASPWSSRGVYPTTTQLRCIAPTPLFNSTGCG